MNLNEQNPQSPSEYRTIPLTQGYVAIIDASDYERVSVYKWHARRGLTNNTAYAYNRRFGFMHRFILGVSDPSIEIDHQDGNGLNNRRSNIRTATRRQNSFNAKYSNKTGFRGVQFKAGRYLAKIGGRLGGFKYLGSFITPIEAAIAYDEAARERHGEFAQLNFPSGSPTVKAVCRKKASRPRVGGWAYCQRNVGHLGECSSSVSVEEN